MKIKHLLFTLLSTIALCIACAQPLASVIPLDDDRVPDVRVIIDISGSMKQNDPQNLRRPALELLVQLFPEGSKAGVWTFGQWVNMLVPHKPVTAQWRRDALSKAQKINSVALRTNIYDALIKATDDIDRLDDAYKTSIILLTDGMVDISSTATQNTASRQRIIDEIIPRLRRAGVSVHTVALSNNADQQLMTRLAVDTNGLAAVAQTADDLTRIFLQAFDAAAPAEQVPFEGNSFLIDSSIDEYTALVFRKKGSPALILTAPDGTKHSYEKNSSDIKWFSNNHYDLITVKNPVQGHWTVLADLEPNSRVTIVSDLSLHVSTLAKSTFVGKSTVVSAVLKEQGKNIVNAELLTLIDMSVDISRRHHEQRTTLSLSQINPTPSEGIFTSALTLQDVGVYDISVEARSKTFQRRFRQTVQVRERFALSATSTDDSPPNHEVILSAVDPDIVQATAKVTARITLPNGSSANQPLTANTKHTWPLSIQGIDQSGVYSVSFMVTGEYHDKTPFSYESSPVEIAHTVIGSPVEAQPILPLESEAPPQRDAEQESETQDETVLPDAEPGTVINATPDAATAQNEDYTVVEYASMAVVNLLILLIGYFAYRALTTKTDAGVLDLPDEDLSDNPSESAGVEAPHDVDGGEHNPQDELDEPDAITTTSASIQVPEFDEDVDDISAEIDLLDEDDALDDLDVASSGDEPSLDPTLPDDILALPDDAIDIAPTDDDDL